MADQVVTLRPATRSGARLVIALAGQSGSGKTYTALELAYGLTKRDPSKIGLLDAENRRGSLYSEIFSDPDRPDRNDTPFVIGDLYAPFSPQRYIDAILIFQRAGVEVLIIDSGSHEWEGIGGCWDIAHAQNPRLPNWNKAKEAHKKFMNVMLTSNMHIILCLRAREKSKPEKKIIDGQEKTVYVDYGLQPITERNVMYEATISLMMHDRGMSQEVVKPGSTKLLPYIGRGSGHITANDGLAIREWVDGGGLLDPEVEHARNSLTSICEQGLAALEKAWKALSKNQRAALGEEFIKERKASAEEYERIAREAADDGGLADLNNAVLSGASAPGPAPSPSESDDLY